VEGTAPAETGSADQVIALCYVVSMKVDLTPDEIALIRQALEFRDAYLKAQQREEAAVTALLTKLSTRSQNF
jgi:hypothetical protein